MDCIIELENFETTTRERDEYIAAESDANWQALLSVKVGFEVSDDQLTLHGDQLCQECAVEFQAKLAENDGWLIFGDDAVKFLRSLIKHDAKTQITRNFLKRIIAAYHGDRRALATPARSALRTTRVDGELVAVVGKLADDLNR
jgi:hypothetical protein